MEYGLQMYSVRDLSQVDLAKALAEVARLGYSFVEFAGFFDHSAKDVRAMLDANGLSVSGTHTGWGELTPEHLEATIAYHKEIGNSNIIIPGADLSTPEKLDAFIDLLNDVQPKLAAEGISLGYHNHHREFLPNEFGVLTHTELEKRTNVEFEIDTYWAYVAGEDPIAVLERLSDRIRVIHLKDGFSDGHGKALGEGTAPVAAVREYAIKHGLCIVVESETCDPTGILEVERCIKYLRSLEA
jgi:sugar phosphate isomerase/epimerase